MHALIQNSKGMATQLIAMAYGPDGDAYYRRSIYALDLAGAITAVKAIWASCLSGGPMKTFGIGENSRKFRGDKEAKYRTCSSQPLPYVVHYHLVVAPVPDADYYVLTSLTCESREVGLYHVLRLYTPLPILPDWSKALFELGLSRKYMLITKLDAFGMEWAYRIDGHGWDTVLDEAAKEGIITVQEEPDG